MPPPGSRQRAVNRSTAAIAVVEAAAVMLPVMTRPPIFTCEVEVSSTEPAVPEVYSADDAEQVERALTVISPRV